MRQPIQKTAVEIPLFFVRNKKNNLDMCLYSKLIKNRKYTPNAKNGYTNVFYKDIRTLYVPVGCGNCIECRKQKARAWQVRLHEELKHNKGYFVTLTFSCEELEKIKTELGVKEECNAAATLAVRRFCERWRKKYGKSIRHWLITELGHNGTERIHLHGLLFTNDIQITNDLLQSIWKYGNTYVGDYCTARTINYIVKYVTKIDTDHKTYKSIILCSAGLGNQYINQFIRLQHGYKGTNTKDYYILPSGQKVNMPIYYRNKLYNDDQREILWLERLDKNERFVMGTRIKNVNTEAGKAEYFKVLEEAQQDNYKLGYGDNTTKWDKETYNITLKMLNKERE